MKASGHIKGQIFGYRELPEQSGLWGMLLPKPNDRSVAHQPTSPDGIKIINTRNIVLVDSSRIGNRGFIFSLFLPMTMIALTYAAWTLTLRPHPEAPQWIILFGAGMFISIAALFGCAAYVASRSPLVPPLVIDRLARRAHVWSKHEKKWISLLYDTLAPATFVQRTVTSSGAITSYLLTLCQLKPGTREIEYAIVPAPAQATPQACGELWEFIRRYMDGDPGALPPVRLVPPVDHPKAWMARTDRTVFAGQIDEQHRIKRDWFSIAVVWFWGSVGYWWERAGGWIERTAPRVPLPPELQKEGEAEATPPYRIIPPSPVEQQARAGKLPHMRRRWFICGVIGTAIWGTLFGLVTAGIWLMR